MKLLWFNEIFLCNFQEQTLRFRLSRFNRYVDYYDGDGDWGWFTVNIDEDKEQFYNLDIPLTTDDWFFNVFTVSKENGIGIINTPVSFSSKRPIHFYCEGKLRIEKITNLVKRSSRNSVLKGQKISDVGLEFAQNFLITLQGRIHG